MSLQDELRAMSDEDMTTPERRATIRAAADRIDELEREYQTGIRDRYRERHRWERCWNKEVAEFIALLKDAAVFLPDGSDISARVRAFIERDERGYVHSDSFGYVEEEPS